MIEEPERRPIVTRNLRILWVLVASLGSLQAQWIKYPTAGVPHLPNGQPDLNAPAPKTADGKPDFTGVWQANRDDSTELSFGGNPIPREFSNLGVRLKDGLPYTVWARELMQARKANNERDSPDTRCLPVGILWLHTHLFPWKFLQMPGLAVILYEKNTSFRQIYMDNRPLPVDPEPSFYGYSVGAWEGDTLVVRTIGIRDDTWADSGGSPITESAKITERFRRPKFGRLEVEITVEDAKAYTAPWTVKILQDLRVDSDLLEFICVDNEKKIQHLVGQ